MKMISLEVLMYIHNQTISKHGGKEGVNNMSLIESALETPFLIFAGEDLNKTIEDKISALTYSLINNHGFRDGNKRVGTIVMGVLCKMNKINLKFSQAELIEFGLNVANGSFSKDDVKQWILSHII
ncbi:type II toxin-antitoxin system death-on-curing family toxin [Clostridium botulinum]|uniref:Type II toxin-antitoxin system death-on-curing family toxin n=1 Tax=Clostridium botulinum TaxID=1491 RepID=A0AA43Y7Q1_CLOBO|nr:type II toxin-antitoxin system death-on-curing family toxin [Clostridium botulinum]NFI21748.1 type II toxin-antitoxin system death-on-curing family toxin [Clostridium botulinum]NFQ77617.1 type II toxin-antitoxin system death-on-curing family toxin [Clostridium botulinum]